jgi:hypothetical protein
MLLISSRGFRRLVHRALAWLAIAGGAAVLVAAYRSKAHAYSGTLGPQDNTQERRFHFVPTDQYEKRQIEGWTVYVNKDLLKEQRDLGQSAIRLLEAKLYEIRRSIPPSAYQKLRLVPIWLGIDDGIAPCAEYHWDKRALTARHLNPAKARCVEIGSAAKFVDWSRDQPAMVLHELSHAYHDRVVGKDNRKLRDAFNNAVRTHKYDSVLRYNGSREKAYAVSQNEMEFFAEASESFFATNDYYPFVRAELREFDPGTFGLLRELWGDSNN